MSWQLKKFSKFAAVGIFMNVSGFLIYLLFVSVFEFDPLLVVTIATPIFIYFAFNIQQRLIFTKGEYNVSKLPYFFVNYALIYLLNITGIFVLVKLMAFDPIIVQGFLIILLGIFNYFLSKSLLDR